MIDRDEMFIFYIRETINDSNIYMSKVDDCAKYNIICKK